jgi:hypothetical protein
VQCAHAVCGPDVKKYMIRTIVTTLGLHCAPSFALAKSCTDLDAVAAEREAATLDDWRSVYQSFKKYSACDDASISEGYSASVARLMASEWESFGLLSRLANQDRGFAHFVIKHIDETWSPKEAILVQANAINRCPAKARRFCERVLVAIADAHKY